MKKNRIKTIEKELKVIDDKHKITEIIVNFVSADGKNDSTMIVPIKPYK
jgi:hypothetical protein